MGFELVEKYEARGVRFSVAKSGLAYAGKIDREEIKPWVKQLHAYLLSRFISEGIKKGFATLPCRSKDDAEALLSEVRRRLPENQDVTVIRHGEKFLLNIYSWTYGEEPEKSTKKKSACWWG